MKEGSVVGENERGYELKSRWLSKFGGFDRISVMDRSYGLKRWDEVGQIKKTRLDDDEKRFSSLKSVRNESKKIAWIEAAAGAKTVKDVVAKSDVEEDLGLNSW